MRAARIIATVSLACWLLALGSAYAASPEELFEKGNEAYAKGRYAESAEAYREALRLGIRDPRLEYNLGCAAFRMGRLGEAILHFERARRMEPGDADVLANLELARGRVIDRVEAPAPSRVVAVLEATQDALGADGQLVALLATLWCIAGIVAWCSARPGGWNARAGWALVVLGLAATLLALSWRTTWNRLEGRAEGVILAPVVEVLGGPGSGNATLFTVHEGLKVEVRSEQTDWVQVSLPNGLNGWVPKDALGLL